MGNEIGQFREWDEKREQDWSLLEYPAHQSFHKFMTDLNQLYMKHPALSEKDYETEGFRWIDCHQEERCIYAFERVSMGERIVAIFNFSNVEQKDYKFKVSGTTQLQRLIFSDQAIYGGTEKRKKITLKSKNDEFTLTLPPYSAVYYLVK